MASPLGGSAEAKQAPCPPGRGPAAKKAVACERNQREALGASAAGTPEEATAHKKKDSWKETRVPTSEEGDRPISERMGPASAPKRSWRAESAAMVEEAWAEATERALGPPKDEKGGPGTAPPGTQRGALPGDATKSHSRGLENVPVC